MEFLEKLQWQPNDDIGTYDLSSLTNNIDTKPLRTFALTQNNNNIYSKQSKEFEVYKISTSLSEITTLHNHLNTNKEYGGKLLLSSATDSSIQPSFVYAYYLGYRLDEYKNGVYKATYSFYAPKWEWWTMEAYDVPLETVLDTTYDKNTRWHVSIFTEVSATFTAVVRGHSGNTSRVIQTITIANTGSELGNFYIDGVNQKVYSNGGTMSISSAPLLEIPDWCDSYSFDSITGGFEYIFIQYKVQPFPDFIPYSVGV